MPPRRRKATNNDAPIYQHSFRIELSCGHAQLRQPPIPQLGTTIKCSPCQGESMVIVVDSRELEVYCPTHGVIRKCHALATLTAETATASHNITENRGRCHAIVRTAGTVDRIEPTTDLRATLRDEGRGDGSLF